MIDPGEATLATFADHLGDTFRICLSDELAVEVTLAEAVALGDARAPGERAPFSITFHGPGERILPQRIYHVEHDTIGACEIFLVPLAPKGGAARYEAVFA
jgi:hypothetical protein